MGDSLANDGVQGQEVKDENGQKIARQQEGKSCGVKQTSNEVPDNLDKESESQKTAQNEGRNVITGVNDVSDKVTEEELARQDIKDENTHKLTLLKGERKHEVGPTLNELSDSSEMSVSESSLSDLSGRLSPTLFLPEARVRVPKKMTEEVNESLFIKKKEKRKLKLSEMDPEDLILRASEKGRFDLVEYSLNKNGSLHECQDQDGYTPLHRASYGGHLKIVELLVSRGANIGARTIDGWEPLHSACRWGQKDVAVYLLENGANINAKTNGNQTPLHLAALGVDGSETLQFLLTNKSLDRTITNNQGETAEDVAKRCGKWVDLFKN
ncbi:ankyrin repeat domain-containing protein 49-like [Actinia tenebrosa]|uniref:Ankyrin repeat domain-containing protein 49-like n=1 Tax=Actinia tenebrosa TaxID=6105 RepID=A0A6P8I5Z0_ACTTE|nr:ankyrin repeat domain-containing protein 49-like [Actinia tenebrosa]